ncbi:hypothetical protein FRC11_009816 [Ceratobasidium sp. 423]|nr:hypothetical protein FRC11_009816 [Ceratobasidium sp. 423]
MESAPHLSQLNVEKHIVEKLPIRLALEGKVEEKIGQVAFETREYKDTIHLPPTLGSTWMDQGTREPNGVTASKVVRAVGDAAGEFERMGGLMM